MIKRQVTEAVEKEEASKFISVRGSSCTSAAGTGRRQGSAGSDHRDDQQARRVEAHRGRHSLLIKEQALESRIYCTWIPRAAEGARNHATVLNPGRRPMGKQMN